MKSLAGKDLILLRWPGFSSLPGGRLSWPDNNDNQELSKSKQLSRIIKLILVLRTKCEVSKEFSRSGVECGPPSIKLINNGRSMICHIALH